MLVIYTSKVTNRIKYTLDFVFQQYFGIPYEITENPDFTGIQANVHINYSTINHPSVFSVFQHDLLLEQDIREQHIAVSHTSDFPVFFQTEKSFDLSFDIFSCIFYLLSRYEEYLPHEKDVHGRFPSSASLLARQEFEFAPIVETWLHFLKGALKKQHPQLVFKEHRFEYLPTFDIDNAYRFLGRNWLKHPPNVFDAGCRKVLLGNWKDPFDVQESILPEIKTLSLQPIFFFLLNDDTQINSNVSPQSSHLHQLILSLSDYEIGIHPSYFSSENNTIQKEKILLESIAERKILVSRQHFLKFSFPDTFRKLIAAGIQTDFSLSYPDVSGFRAGCSRPFYFFDLEKDAATGLLLQPSCWMDATFVYYPSQKNNNPLANFLTIFNQLKKINGKLVPIFHNDLLAAEMFRGIIGFIHQHLKSRGNEK